MLKTEIGPRIYQDALAAAVLNYQPPFDRAAIIRRLCVSNVSANDTWTVTVGGREIMRFRILTTGNQRLLQPAVGTQGPKDNWFDHTRTQLGVDPSIPVPLGMTLTVASLGGATADIVVEGKEVDQGDVNAPGAANHYRGNLFIIPIYWSLAAAQAAAALGAVQFDTQVAPPYVPALFSNLGLPVNWKVELLALFLEGGGVNTFSGAANHQSQTRSVWVVKNQVQILTRTAHGLPDRGLASAAGSVNTVVGQQSGFFSPFELDGPDLDSVWDTPVQLLGGEALQLLLEMTGDGTGGASYANFLQVATARVTVPQASPGSL